MGDFTISFNWVHGKKCVAKKGGLDFVLLHFPKSVLDLSL